MNSKGPKIVPGGTLLRNPFELPEIYNTVKCSAVSLAKLPDHIHKQVYRLYQYGANHHVA